MAASASAFAAALTEDLHESVRGCQSRYLTAQGWTALCGEPGGSALSLCPNGHRRARTVCRTHAPQVHNCVPCYEATGLYVATEMRTEVA